MISPPIPPTYEKDTAFRKRIALAPGSYTNAGTAFGYVALVRDQFAWVGDVAITCPTSGLVRVYLMEANNLIPNQEKILQVTAFLNGKNRQLGVDVAARAAEIVNFEISATLTVYPNIDQNEALEKAKSALNQFLEASKRFGYDITIAGITAALFIPGYVQNVNVISPISDVVCRSTEVASCHTPTITIGGRDV